MTGISLGADSHRSIRFHASSMRDRTTQEASDVSPDREVFSSLSETDRELVRLVCSGLTDGEIAARLEQPEGSVRQRVVDILGLIGAVSRTQLVISAVGHGL